MARSDNLRKAKEEQNDEFYTKIEDIVSEIVQHPDYVRHFEGKTVLCNCDDPEWSNFVEFFRKFFKKLKLKKMIATHFIPNEIITEQRPILDKKGNPKKNKDGSIQMEEVVVKEIVHPSYKLEWYGEKINGDTVNLIKTPLQGNGDFRSEECVELLKEADIIVTNPPFSNQLPVALVNLCLENNKDFILIGDENMIAYKSFLPLFKEGKVFLGYTRPKEFRQPDGTFKKFGNKVWFTNIEIDKIHEPIPLTKNYKGNEDKYPKYNNYDGIDVSKIKLIPKDYDGVMGVPISMMENLCFDQFEIIGGGTGKMAASIGVKKNYRGRTDLAITDSDGTNRCPYNRILIRRKQGGTF